MKTSITVSIIFLLLIIQYKVFAQMGINATGATPANNAMLDISSTTKGLLIPRMNTSERTTLAHTKGLTVFDITTNGYWYSDGSAWVNLATISSASPWLTSGNNIYNGNAGNVGIGTNSPNAPFNVANRRTVLFGTDTSGGGKKLIWYENKGAFRVGYLHEDSEAFSNNPFQSNVSLVPDDNIFNWNEANVGRYSFACGENTKAVGYAAIAMGNYSKANGSSSTAIGRGSISSGSSALSLGDFNLASGSFSVAIGNTNEANNNNSLAIGNLCNSSGINSLAMGYNNTANGNFSTALGANANSNGHVNSFCINGANAGIVTNNTADKQMMMRFDNYTFFLGNTGNYVYLLPASNGWTYVSDKNKKENFEELNGETVLNKISKIPFYSWNFKGKEVKQFRHYGIMAQDFYQNFGKDKLGVIGNDTTVSTLDLLGVAYSGIKALEKRTAELQKQNEQLTHKNDEFRIKNEKLEARLENIEKMLMIKREN